MALTRKLAVEKMHEWTDSPSLRKHMRAVELVMRAAAHRYGEGACDEERYAIAGLIHDADYERWPASHPGLIVAWLREQGEEDIAQAVSAHYTGWGVPCESMLDKALLACDELTGFVVACALVRPEGIETLTPKSVRKRLKSLRFAAGVDREEVRAGVEQLGVELNDHIQMIIDALRPYAEELGIGGRA